MATEVEKTKAVIEAQNNASKIFKVVTSDFGKMVGAIAGGSLAANVFEKALGKVGDALAFVKDSTLVAARIEVLNRVFLMTGQNAGYTAEQLRNTKEGLEDLGIAEEQALQIGQRFIQAQLDIADALLVARAAQDLAVVAGTNSSETALALTDAIVKQKPILLKQFGIISNLNDIYGAQAEALGKTIEQLTESEKRSAFLNEILRQSETVAGAYESAMADVGKRLTSLPRHIQGVQNALGTLLLPALGLAVDGFTEFLKGTKDVLDVLADDVPRDVRKATKALESFQRTGKETKRLTEIYDDLKIESDLSTEATKNLADITKKLGEQLPEAVTQWNEYGDAIKINTGLMRDLIVEQGNVLKADQLDKLQDMAGSFADNADRVRQFTTEINGLTDQLPGLTEKAEESKKVFQGLAGSTAQRNLERTQDRIVDLVDELKELDKKQRAMLAIGRILYPDMEAGSQEWADAMALVNQEFADALVKQQELGNFDGVLGAQRKREQLEATKVAIDGVALADSEFLDKQRARWEEENINFNAGVERDELQTETDAFMDEQADLFHVAAMDRAEEFRKLQSNMSAEELAEYLRTQKAKRSASEKFTAAIGAIANRGVDNMIDSFVTGRQSISEAFKGMADDFAAFFIKQALASIVNIFIPGLGSILGAIFDTPKNDRMAMTQGAHFANWFTAGALQTMQSFPTLFAGAAAGSMQAGLAPVGAGNGGGLSGGLVLQIGGGSITEEPEEYIQDTVIPYLEAAATRGAASFVVNQKNVTGADDGDIF